MTFQPTTTTFPYLTHDWLESASNGWWLASTGHFEAAEKQYRRADESVADGSMKLDPKLSLLRHKAGHAQGRVIIPPPKEDGVVAFEIPSESQEAPDAKGMKKARLDQEIITSSIRRIIKGYNGGFHRKNINDQPPQEHVLTLSTGRCGTVSCFHLFKHGNHMPYHSYFWNLSFCPTFEMMARVLSGNLDDLHVANRWAETRAAEWLGAASNNRPMIGFYHPDTIFAPVFAALHKQSKFIYLRRDANAVFDSFFSKHQWSEFQLCPFFYSFDPEFRFHRIGWDTARLIGWYMAFTHRFAQAMETVLGEERVITVSANRLFQQDKSEIDKLLEFTNAHIHIKDAIEHFKTPYNQKRHKMDMTHSQLEGARKIFNDSYQEFLSE